MEKRYFRVAGLFFIIGNIIYLLDGIINMITLNTKFYYINSVLTNNKNYIIYIFLGYALISNKKNLMVIIALVDLLLSIIYPINYVSPFTRVLSNFICPMTLFLFFLVNNNFHICNYRINMSKKLSNILMLNKHLLLLPQIIQSLILFIKNIINFKMQYSIKNILTVLPYMALVIASYYTNREHA